jgi:hypothetical protein
MSERGYNWIKDLKKQTGKNVPELLALSQHSDPFFIGSPADIAQGEWFARMWKQEYDGHTGVHVRRVHYRLDALGFLKLDGMPYRNPDDWDHLLRCSRAARILGLVPADAFDDHRNSDPYPLPWRKADTRAPAISGYQPEWRLPSFRTDFSLWGWTIDTPVVDGYEPDDFLDRAYLLEVWVEKSTVDDILMPLAQELGFRLVPSSGYQSISNVVKLLQRLRETGKPARIFYVSDHDKAGRQMPIAVARQIEFWRPEYAPGANVKLQPIALTTEQVTHYKLPSNEEGNTELDALEAIVPGEIERIVRDAVAPYLDNGIDGDLRQAKGQAEEMVSDQWSRWMQPYEQRLAALHKRVKSATKKYEKEAANLNKRLARDLRRFQKPLAQLQVEVSKRSSSFSPSLPSRPAQEPGEQDEGDWLFDSARPYLEQLRFYKAQR